MANVAQIAARLQNALHQNIGSGMAASFGPDVYLGQSSHMPGARAIDEKSIFDLASLTKILATTTLYMIWSEAGLIDIDAGLEVYLADEVAQHPHLKGITLKHLLSHTSGLPAWKPFYEEMRVEYADLNAISIAEKKKNFYPLVFATGLENPVGEKAVYSDLGFLILGYIAEKLSGQSLDQLMNAIWSRIPGCELHYRPVGDRDLVSEGRARDLVVATEICPWRGLLQGEVHDDNAYSMGGVAGHAGVFGTLASVKAWVNALLSGNLVTLATLRLFAEEVKLKRWFGLGACFRF